MAALPREAGFITVPTDHLPVEQPLPYAVHIRIDSKLIEFRKANDRLTKERVASLGEKGVQALFVSKVEWRGYVDSMESSLSLLGENDTSEGAAFSAKSLLYAYARSIEEDKNVESGALKRLEKITARISKAISKDIALAGKLLRRYNDPSLFFSNHALNMCIFSTAIGIKFGVTGTDLQELAFAACVANIGLVKIPNELLYKPSEPTTEEWKLLRRHPQEGEIILKLLLVPPRVSLAALQHHERFDGGGYPKGLKGEEISLFARIIAVAERFSSLTSVKPWEPAIPADQAIAQMRDAKGRFDPMLLNISMGGR
jgi:HD-GYP domain-containing protein (c-di-GMP phosphodiesterase class II)